jgi:hypothetical protein
MSTFYLKLTDARFALGRVSFLTAKSTHFFNGSSASLGLLSHAIRVVGFARVGYCRKRFARVGGFRCFGHGYIRKCTPRTSKKKNIPH